MTFTEDRIPQFDVVFGHNLMAEAVNFADPPLLVATMADRWPRFRDRFPDRTAAYFVSSLERRDPKEMLPRLEGHACVVGVGGSQAIDCAKYFAWRRRLPLFQFPTSLSVDAVFGHRAGVRERARVRDVA